MSSSVSCLSLCSPFVHSFFPPSPGLWDRARTKSLPNDVLLVVRDYLAEGKHNDSLARLARASKGFRDIFQPAIRCEELVVSKDNVEKVFWGLTGLPSFPRSQRSLPPEEEDGRVSYKTPNANSDSGALGALGNLGTSPRPTARPTFATHRRKVKVLRACTRMVLQDLVALEGCFEAIEALGQDNSVFKNVRHLSLGPDLTWALGRNLPVAYNGREALLHMFSPTHLCVHFHIGDTRYLYAHQLMWTGCYQDLREGAILSVCASLAEKLVQSWELESITLHDITAENLPEVGGKPLRVFFSPRLPHPDLHVRQAYMTNQTRAVGICDIICLLGGPDESIEFVGADDALAKPDQTQEDGEREKVDGKKTVEDLVWGTLSQDWLQNEVRPRVSFRKRDEAEGCVCCGGK